MNLLNRFFTPFAAVLILSAVAFGAAEREAVRWAIGVWLLSIGVNWWLSRNIYRYVGWAPYLRELQVWLNFLWAVPLFWLLQGFWGPMWLLFVMAPVTAAITQGRWQTVGTACVSAGTMLALYWLRGLEGDAAWAMAGVHAVFILVFSLFVNTLAETALRLRDVRT